MFTRFPLFRYLLLVAGCMISGWVCAEATGSKPLSVSVVPQFPPIAIHKAWTPVLQALTAKTGLAFELKVEPSIPAFENSLATGVPDIAFMNPYHMLVARKHQGYVPIIRDSGLLNGIVVVRKDSPIDSVAALAGQVLAFPAPNAFAASLLIRAQLANSKIDINPVYVKTHSNVYRAVLMGDAVAGGGVNNTFQREPADIKDQLRVLHTTSASAPHPLAVHARVSQTDREKIATAFLSLAENPENAELLNAIQIPKPVLANYERDYLPLELLGLDKFAVTGGD